MMNYLWGSSKKLEEVPAPKRRLQVRIGPSVDTLSIARVNDDSHPHFIDSPYFTGHVAVRIKNFEGVTPDNSTPIKDTPYFGSRKRLLSIQLSGRFKQEYTVDDVVFGAIFDHKPTGCWIAIKFANYIDPALATDVYSDKPWLLSPMLCSMNVVNVQKDGLKPADNIVYANIKPNKGEVSASSNQVKSSPSPSELVGEWVWGGEKELHENNSGMFDTQDDLPFESDNLAERRKYFQKQSHRQDVVFKKDRVYHLEIFAPFIDFNTFDLNLGINVNLVRYVNKQPIRLCSKSQSKNVSFFVVEFDLVDEHGRGLASLEGSSPVGSEIETEIPDEAELEKKMKEMEK